jgi:hypothetical protein
MNTERIVISTALLTELCKQLETLRNSEYTLFIGFDGFIDTIQKAVKKKEYDRSVYFKTIKEFSEHIQSLSGKSGQIEIVTSKIKMGGNGPIFSNALGRLGMHSYCIGSMGFPEINPVFKDMHKYSHAVPVNHPGTSQAIEFDDGKIIFSELDVFAHYDWAHIRQNVGVTKLRQFTQQSQLIALVDWVNLPHASDMWEGYLNDVIRPLGKKDFYFFFDLCDPSKKSVQQIDEILDIISCFSSYGKVTLGLNENETNKIWLALNGYDLHGKSEDAVLPDISTAGQYIYNAMNIDTVLIHPIDRTVAITKGQTLELKGRVVQQPKVLTGGGDNLNAGYCLGLLAGLDRSKCMLLGMAASGTYVQNGNSPDFESLIGYLKGWADELNPSKLDLVSCL